MEAPNVPTPYLLRYDDWLGLPDDGHLYELIDGELFVSPPPSIAHQRVARDLGFLLLTYLRATGRGELLTAPVGVRLDERSVLEPDLIVVLAEHVDRVGLQVVSGPPDLVVEILAPGTARRDLGTKREKYRASGVREYWVVDPANESIEVLALENNAYRPLGVYGRAHTFESRVLVGFAVTVAQVFDPQV